MSQPFDDTAKTFYRQFFEQRGLRAITQYEVFARSRAIDLFVECPPDAPKVLDDTVFAHFKQFNSLEFKGINDNLTAPDFNRIMMRAWGIGGLEEPKKDDDEVAEKPKHGSTPKLSVSPKLIAQRPDLRTVTIVSVVKPVQILTTLQKWFQFQPTNEPGVYLSRHHGFPIWIIYPTELTLKPANYPLLPLARGEKLAQFIQLCEAQNLTSYLQLTLDLGQTNDPEVILQKIMEMFNMTVTIRDETVQMMEETFRRRPELFQKFTFLQEKMLEAEQTLLMRLLHKKFGTIPAPIIKKIQSTSAFEQLEQWHVNLLFANTLEEVLPDESNA